MYGLDFSNCNFSFKELLLKEMITNNPKMIFVTTGMSGKNRLAKNSSIIQYNNLSFPLNLLPSTSNNSNAFIN